RGRGRSPRPRVRPARDRRHVGHRPARRGPGRRRPGGCGDRGDQPGAVGNGLDAGLPVALDRCAGPADAHRCPGRRRRPGLAPGVAPALFAGGARARRRWRSAKLARRSPEPRRPAMPGLLPHVDPDGLLEYSVVFTDRALNHMSRRFQQVMLDISATLKEVYNAPAAIVMPGSGSFGMEGVARQFAHGRKCLVIRTGWFSYRWTQIFEMGGIPSESIVLKARPTQEGRQAPWAPPPFEEVVDAIAREKTDLVFAPHVETAAGLMLPDDYMRQVAEATHGAGGMFVLDCI